jgi:hypothetical protein
MAKRSASTGTVTLTGFADTTALTNNAYCGCLSGGTTTQRTNIIEVYVGGQSTSSAVTIMMLARDSTIAVTLVAGTSYFDTPMDASTAALGTPLISGNSAATPPQRSTTGHLLNLTFNAFGGIVRWVAAPGEEISIIGQTVSLGQASLSAFTGTPGIVGSHIIYETF